MEGNGPDVFWNTLPYQSL